jgi:ABC-type lipoprotein export system ATPase subunit
MNSSLYAPDGYEIPLFNKDYKYFLNKSIMLYGTSGSGKSTIMFDILYILKDHIPNMCLICSTNKLNNSYDGIIPPQLIYPEVTEDLIKKIFNRQSVVVKMWNLTNDLDRLENIYNKLTNKENSTLQLLKDSYSKIKKKINENENTHIADKKTQNQELDDSHKQNLISFYKKIINKNKPIINRQNNLDELEIKIVNYININPNFLMILDDMATTANVWSKYQEMKELFFNGRHHKITFMISFQDDKPLDSGLRKNTFINIFTTEVVCNSFFGRTANNFTKKEQNKMAKLANFIFNDEKLKTKNYKKMVYIKDLNPNLYYMLADHHEDFRFGSKHLYHLCNKVEKEKNDDDDFTDNFASFF